MSMRYHTSAVKRQNRDGWIMQDSERYHLEERDKYKELFYSFVRAMSKAIDERTPYNGTHTRHMVWSGGRFLDFINRRAAAAGRNIPFGPGEREEILMSIWLHDVGKLVIPLSIMDKERRLRPEEETAICYRMEIIRLGSRVDYLEGRLSLREMKELIHTTRELEDLIYQINRWGDVDDASLKRLWDMQQLTYEDTDGNRLPWLTGEEYQALSVVKGTLTPEERRIMEGHVAYTDQVLSELQFPGSFSHVRQWAAAHHELLDGSGYPKGLKGDAIPYQVRIITILDIFDALVADDRPYKPGIPVDRALDILTRMARKGKLDSRLTELFVESRCWEGLGGLFDAEKSLREDENGCNQA